MELSLVHHRREETGGTERGMGTQGAPAPSPSVSAMVVLTVMRAGQSGDERDTPFFSYPSQGLVGRAESHRFRCKK